MNKIRNGGMGMIEEGALQGRRFIIPSEVFVEKGEMNGQINFSRACLIHQKFVPDGGCPECIEEIREQEQKAKDLGL